MALKFNIEELQKMKAACMNARQELDTLGQKLNSALTELKSEWNTPAGDKFFEDLEDDWTVQIGQYKKITSEVEKLVDTAIREYASIEERANQLKVG